LHRTEQEPARETKATAVHFDTGAQFVEQEPEFWERTSPEALAKRIERADARIEFHPGENPEFMHALARVRLAIPSSRWSRILERLEPGIWMSCDNGPDWDPRVLGNGGVAIRNFHRILGIELGDGVSVSGVKAAQIRREVQSVLRRGLAEPGVMLMHHGPKGIIFSLRVPENCRFRGQSILFAPASLVEGLEVLGAAARSRQGMLAIRLFQDTVCVYTIYRHSDDADTAVESFALARFDLDSTFSMSDILDGANAWPEFLKWVNDDLDQELPDFDVPLSLQEDIRTLMTSDEPNSWASRLFKLMKQFPPLFGKDHLRPHIAGPRTAWATGNRRCCIYSFEGAVSALRVTRAIAALHMEGAKPLKAPGAEGIPSVRTPYLNVAEARKVAVALCQRFGPLWLTIPHLGLDHREAKGGRRRGNGAWYGFARRGGVVVGA
jgi:hypothetical protein